MWEDDSFRGSLHFGKGDVEIGVYINDFSFELLAAGEYGEERGFPPREMRVGGDDAGFGDEKAGAGLFQPFEVDDSRFGGAHEFFEGKFGPGAGSFGGGKRGDAAGENLRDRLQIHVELIGLQEEIFAANVAFEGDPVHGTFGEGNFLSGVAGEGNTGDHGVLEAAAESGFGFVKVPAGKVFFEGRDASGDAVELNGGAGRSAGDFQSVGERSAGKEKKE